MIHWSAPEYNFHEKDVSWYWLVIIFAIIVTAISLWQRNFLFAVFIIIATAIILFLGHREPNNLDFKLDDDGVYIGEKFYKKGCFDQFALQKHDGEWSKLFLKTKFKIITSLILPIPSSEFDKVKDYCLNFWAETEYEESLIDSLADVLKF